MYDGIGDISSIGIYKQIASRAEKNERHGQRHKQHGTAQVIRIKQQQQQQQLAHESDPSSALAVIRRSVEESHELMVQGCACDWMPPLDDTTVAPPRIVEEPPWKPTTVIIYATHYNLKIQDYSVFLTARAAQRFLYDCDNNGWIILVAKMESFCVRN